MNHSRSTSHDDDFFAWSQHQAALLRAASVRAALPAELDLEHLAEEVEDLGRSELRAVESLIRLILSHVAKAASVPGAPAVPHWRTEVVTWHNDLLAAFSPAMAQRIDLDVLWRRALKEAASALAEHGETLRPGLPDAAPLTLPQLLDDNFTLETALDALR